MKKSALKQLESLKANKNLDKLKSNKSLWLIVAVVVLILAALPAYYYYNQYQKAQMLLQNPKASATAEASALVDKVGKLIQLPTTETPTIATVSDVSKLEGQAFFANAKNGDKVLIFTQTKEAILYRESINKIIQVAPVNLGSAAPVTNPTPVVANQPTAAPTPATFTVAIYNGTTTSGLANKADSAITQAMSNATIAQKGDAKGNYSKTEVVDLSGNNSDAATQIAKLLSGSVATSAPDGEAKAGADILVILGTDFAK
jgi:hypothetical protein